MGRVSDPINGYVLILGIFLLAVGLLFLGRRFAFATTGEQSPGIPLDPPAPEAHVDLESEPAAAKPPGISQKNQAVFAMALAPAAIDSTML